MTDNQKKDLKKLTITIRKEAELKAKVEQGDTVMTYFLELYSRGDISKGDTNIIKNYINKINNEKLV